MELTANEIVYGILASYPIDSIPDPYIRFHNTLGKCQEKYSVLKDFKFDFKRGFYFCEEIEKVLWTFKQAGLLDPWANGFRSYGIEIEQCKQAVEELDLPKDELKQLEEISLEIHKEMKK